MSKQSLDYSSGSKRNQRYFSEAFRKARVKDLDDGLTTVREVSDTYNVSTTSVYKWLSLYSPLYKKGVRTVVELESESFKTKELAARVDVLERLLGQKTAAYEFLKQLIEQAEAQYGIEIKKN